MATDLPATSEVLLQTDASKHILDTFLGQGWDTWGTSLGGSQASELMLEMFSAFNLIALAVISALFLWILAVAVAGTQSRGIYPAASNGGEALLTIARHYFGTFGAVILAVTVTFACLKTAVGLITSCSQTFCQLFPRSFSYRVWATGFCIFSFAAANLGLETIIAWALPVLMFLYPLAITLILLALAGKWFDNDRRIYLCVTIFTLAAAIRSPGTFLSQLGTSTRPSKQWACAMVSMESQMSSLLGREYFIPLCPMAIPSQTPMAGTRTGVPPARRTPSLAAWATLSRCICPGTISL